MKVGYFSPEVQNSFTLVVSARFGFISAEGFLSDNHVIKVVSQPECEVVFPIVVECFSAFGRV